jgi:YegS/Rv2252/BmrU family lipid kinase
MDDLHHPNDGSAGTMAAVAVNPRGPATRRALVIFNPTAGWRRRRRLDSTLRLLGEAGIGCPVAATAARGDAERLAYEAASSPDAPDLIIAAGGDGTINEAANGLLRAGAPIPLAILPLGTANVLAAEIGLAIDPAAIAAAIVADRRIEVHVGRANGAGFLLMAGAGFDAHVVQAIRPPVKRLLGKGAYVLETLRQLVRFGFPRYRVTIDGVAHEAASVVVARGRFYGGRYLAAPAARLDGDGFQVCLFESGGRLAVLRYGAALVMDRLPRAGGYRIVSGSRVGVEGPAGDPVQADGDIIARLPLDIDLAPRRISLVVP